MTSRRERSNRDAFSGPAILVWMAGIFIAFGILSNLFDGEGLLYNLGQGAFIAILVGVVMFAAGRRALRQPKPQT